MLNPDTSEESVRSGFSAGKHEQLVALNEQWDPENVFRGNHNIVRGDPDLPESLPNARM